MDFFKILQLYARVIKIMRIQEFDTRITKSMKILECHARIIKIMTMKEFYARVKRIMKILELI